MALLHALLQSEQITLKRFINSCIMLDLTIATWDYDRIRPVLDGRVELSGCNLNYIILPPEECFYRAYILKEFEISEIGFIPYIVAKSQGLSAYSAIPVFLSRMFRHSCIYVRKDRGIEVPADLIGKKVGVVEYQMSAATWCRGFLKDIYGVDPSDIYWFQGGVNKPGRFEKFPLQLDTNFPLQKIAETATLSNLLENGELDAVISPEIPFCYHKKCKNIGRLFDNFAEIEREYFQATGIFPIMHALGIRNDIHSKNPWLGNTLYNAFNEAKNIAEQDFMETRALKIGLPWLFDHCLETKKIMGDDPWPYGIDANKKTLQKSLDYVKGQGLARHNLEIKDLFV